MNASPTLLLTRWLSRLRYDGVLMGLIGAVCAIGLMVLYSATGRSMDAVIAQATRMAMGFTVMLTIAQLPPDWLRRVAPALYLAGVFLLCLVPILGDHAKGAVRWLDFKLFRFQPSEIMKLAMPMALATYIHVRGYPVRTLDLLVCGVLLGIPTGLVAVQPDLGTGVLIAASGAFVLYMGGLSWRWILLAAIALAAALPTVWYNLHDYQQQRVLTFLNPGRDPAGAGYHIIQSMIAVGSGGIFGKGWLQSSQAHLRFLPEANTDFILAVFAEEGGMIGVSILLLLYLAIVGRCFAIALRGQDTFQRLLAGSLSCTLFLYVFINMGMVIGILPVVGVPLPLMSYGGTSAIVILTSFGILMSIHTHRKLVAD